MLGKILFVTDLHKRYTDSTNVRGQLKAQDLIQQDIIKAVSDHGITHIVITGDWYHRGFHGLCEAMDCMEWDKRISASVNGNVFLCVGNHFFLERDENPEMYIIQPNDFMKPKKPIATPDKPIFNVVEQLNIGDVQFSFFHYTKLQKNYVRQRNDGVKQHIGIYHDEACVPTWIAEQEGFKSKTSNKYLNKIYDNVDLAIHGHIHSKHGVVVVELDNGKKVPIFVPGSLGIVSNTPKHRHDSVGLPLLTINDDSTIEMGLLNFRTHLEVLKFYDSKAEKDMTVKEREIIREQYAHVPVYNLPDFLRNNGYQSSDVELVSLARTGCLSLTDAINILQKEKENVGS